LPSVVPAKALGSARSAYITNLFATLSQKATQNFMSIILWLFATSYFPMRFFWQKQASFFQLIQLAEPQQ